MTTYLQAREGGVCLSVKVQPRASKNEIGVALGNELKVKVSAPPVDSAANEALVRFLAEVLGCPRGAVALLRGQSSRHKQLLIRGLSVVQVLEKLNAGK
ncbi:MAG TPA: DUF167 domain-containing protein [Candidatus Saccharimonadales bacterium]|nr:DUF167 domain-containing protein [Candidatus Saccharimonadales bacterium]